MKEELENELRLVLEQIRAMQARTNEIKAELFRIRWGFGVGSTIELDGQSMIVEQADSWATCRKTTKKGEPSKTTTTLFSSDLPKVKIINP